MAKPRSEYRTKTGKKRLLKRDKKTGRIVDNQAWRNVTRADQRQKSRAEKAAARNA